MSALRIQRFESYRQRHQRYELIKYNLSKHEFTKINQIDLYVLTMRVVTARVRVFFSGSFASQIETRPDMPHDTDYPYPIRILAVV